jgi:hypothetical protein
MRRLALNLALGSLLMLIALCGLGSLRVWAGQGRELVMPGAGEVRIDRSGVSRLQISYHLPPRKTRDNLRLYLLQQGWRRISDSNVDRETVMTFVRPGWLRQVREILIITTDPRKPRFVNIRFGRCVRISTWLNCF